MSTKALKLAEALIACQSVTPHDSGCQALLSSKFSNANFIITHLPFHETENLWATHGTGSPFILFQGHTDVVPAGPLKDWNTNPFTPTEKEGVLYGRGASDMKAALAAMAQAAIDYCRENPNHPGTIAFAATSDEEGPGDNGMVKVVQWIKEQGIKVDYCITGEPTSVKKLGDTIKVGRRGSLHATITFYGKQGHIAYPHLATNPIHLAMQTIDKLATEIWDKGYKEFEPSSLQFYDIQSGTGASNVIPSQLTTKCNFRYAPCHSTDDLINRVHTILDHGPLLYKTKWTLGAEPFLCCDGKLVKTLSAVIEKHMGIKPELSTSGGTSDSRFFSKLGGEVVDFGLRNATAHQVNECVAIADIESCYNIYRDTITHLLEK
jgi:succinyl-diaminopimelate desuccinylase